MAEDNRDGEKVRTLITETVRLPGVALIRMPANMDPIERLRYIYNVLIQKYPEDE